MIVRFRRGNMTETRPVHEKLDHHVSVGRKRDGYKQLPVSVKFTKYGNTLFRPMPSTITSKGTLTMATLKEKDTKGFYRILLSWNLFSSLKL